MTILDAIRQRVERATKGPWQKYSFTTVLVHDKGKNVRYIVPPDDMCPEKQREEDADFIAHSREDIPALLAVAEAVKDFLDEENIRAVALAGPPDEAYVKLERLIPLRATLIQLLQEVEG